MRDDPAGGLRLWVTDASGTLQPTIRAATIGRPSWGGNLSTVAVPVGGRLYEVGVGNADHPSEVEVFGEGGRRLLNVTAVRLSLDGLRALIIAGTGASARVYVGTLTGASETGGSLVMNAQRLAVEGAPRDVAWYGPVTAAVAVVSPRNSVSVTLSPVDGSPALSRSAEATGADPIRVAADPSYPPQSALPLEIGGHLYTLSKNAGTVKGGTGQAPFYPG